ncbi:alpha-hydroxy acid oxidase [Actinokineospora globicatena]|uniref:alpha-hydroxy acid oxidase n=1 Tax=Actinokineospora globicatena TaxID=103729 RepID=UPI0020A37E0E|nr:alpha-hydroxy acid oxidase [Actinokineospora globicatena]MCP2306555.1 4-hydroxymandelate oxidase [Actinokineospora globicatena]GLW81986.1 alpha-hydroxy-acid oxidizing enzyme [Actinokineospora globicatena]GLW88780.1 alpha-hydroxy-acid oxidizing enzyme [Actinokineospora globicatena]
MNPLHVADYAAAAKATLAGDVLGYLDGGSGAEWTLRENTAAYQRIRLRPRVLVDVEAVDTAVDLLGSSLTAPLGVAPMAYHRLVHPDGELATVAAAGAAGALFVASMFASTDLVRMADAATGPLWMQLYWLRDRGALLDLVGRAERAGYRALVLTVDAPKVARRLRDLRSGFTLPAHVSAVNLTSELMAPSHVAQAGVSAIERHSRERFDPTITWADLAWLRERTRLPLVLKGILTSADAWLAVEHGVDAVVVSNHGGRQLDGVPATVDVLAEVVDAVAGALPVLVDGGVRRGTDVLKALALGAATVLVGRPVLWGLAHSGAAGAEHVLTLLREELEEAMALCGRPTTADVDRSVLG